ncbi:MAG: hypothetical protein CM1200mP39_23460 [Dehalococcoidia bacterium]|nr:MAG: hypothetical protein CM1200mP39_23460 [Dehalococcoidia bacterium]
MTQLKYSCCYLVIFCKFWDAVDRIRSIYRITDFLGFDTADQWKFLSITVLWAGYSTLLIIAGVIARSSFIRLGGLALMSLAVIKLFVHDTFNLEQFSRVAAYIVLGTLLLSAGMLYQRYQSRVRGFFLPKKTGD